MKHHFICVPLQTLGGEIIAIDLIHRHATHPRPEAQLAEQLAILIEHAGQFRHHGLLACIAIDFRLASILVESAPVSKMLEQLPFIRFRLSEDFPNLHDGFANPLLSALAAQHRTLWLGNLGAGGASVNALQSKMFEAVTLDRDFYLKNVHKPTFSVLITHIRRYTHCVLVNSSDNIFPFDQ